MKLSNPKSFSRLEWFFFIGIVWFLLGTVISPSFGVYFEAPVLKPIWEVIDWLVNFPFRAVAYPFLYLGPDSGLGVIVIAAAVYFLTIISINFLAVLLIWIIKKRLFWQGIMITIFLYVLGSGVEHFIRVERKNYAIKMSETMEVKLESCSVKMEDEYRMLKCELAIPNIQTLVFSNDTGLAVFVDFSKQNGERIDNGMMLIGKATEITPNISIKLDIPDDTNVSDIYISRVSFHSDSMTRAGFYELEKELNISVAEKLQENFER